MAEPFSAARKIDQLTVSQYVVVDHWYGRSSRESGRLFAVVRMTRRAMLSLTWKRCSWRRSASASCAGAAGVDTFVLTLLGRIGRHREDAAPGERNAHPVLHVRGDRAVERAEKLLRNGAVLGREDFGGAESHVRVDRAQILENAPAEEPHHVPGVVEVHARETGRDSEQQLVIAQLQSGKERDRGGEVAEGVDAAGKERAGPRPDRGRDLAVDELAGRAMNRRDHDALAKLDRDRRDDVEVVRGRGVRAEEPERKNEEHPSDAEASQQRAGEDALDEERDERRARVDRRIELAEQVLAAGPAAGSRLVEPDEIQEVPELHEEIPEEHADAERPEHPV